MITLNVKPYCHNCDEFEPQSNTAYIMDGPREVALETIVDCVHSVRCAKIAAYLAERRDSDAPNQNGG